MSQDLGEIFVPKNKYIYLNDELFVTLEEFITLSRLPYLLGMVRYSS